MMLQQHEQALQRANEVRLGRASIKRQVGSGELNAVELLEDLPELLEGVVVEDFLTWLPRVGRHRARKMLNGLGMTPTLRLGAMSDRTRHRLIATVTICTPYALSRAA